MKFSKILVLSIIGFISMTQVTQAAESTTFGEAQIRSMIKSELESTLEDKGFFDFGKAAKDAKKIIAKGANKVVDGAQDIANKGIHKATEDGGLLDKVGVGKAGRDIADQIVDANKGIVNGVFDKA
jgi:hypothetical protein